MGEAVDGAVPAIRKGAYSEGTSHELRGDGEYNYRGDRSEMYGNSESLHCVKGTNVVLWVNYTSETNKLIEKEIRFVVTGRGGG